MTRRIRQLMLAGIAAVALCAFNVSVVAANPPSGASSSCIDHSDNGAGNLGDPGNGGNHHNEDVGKGNGGDPGNGQGHFCNDV